MQSITNAIPTGTIAAIPAKAHAHRALIAAALANEPSTILLARSSQDIDATMDSLCALGAHISYENGSVQVVPGKAPLHGAILPNESGTTLRLLLPVAASLCDSVDVDAKGHLPQRPLEPLLQEMASHGVTFSQAAPPFTMTGRLEKGTYTMVGNVSSQFFSGLLLAAPQLGHTTIISSTPLESYNYVALTIQVMHDFGVSVVEEGRTKFIIPSTSTFIGQQNYAIEGDWSNAAIWLVGSALTGQPITVTGLDRDSIQADCQITRILESAGCHLVWNGRQVTCHGNAKKPLRVDLGQIPDLLPVLAALACGIPGESAFINGQRLRFKECDRLDAIYHMVRALGGSVRMEGDNLYIQGTGHLTGGTVNCCHDHRIVMAATLAALIAKNPVQFNDAEAIHKSYPEFFNDWNYLGGKAYVI